MHIAQNIVRYAYVPFMLIVLPVSAYLLVSNGYSYAWLALILVIAFASAFAAEKIAPYFEEWTDHQAHGDIGTNVLHTIAHEVSVINGALLIPVITWLFPFEGIWPTDWPMWAQLAMAFVFADLAFMLIHYWSHHYAPLWRLHAVHHGVGRLYGFNGIVRHPIHQSIDMVIGTAPLVILGMPVDVALLLGLMISLTLIVQHSNVDSRLGPFESHISIGRLHHLHHVNWGTEGDCNFGLFFTIWDKLLGTFNEKPSREITAKDIGIDEVPNFPRHSFVEQMIFPFVYKPGQGEPDRYAKSNKTPAQVAKIDSMQAAE
jgi:sterol desaturase/sphingolipid hydroxylase (fatty acid hydroxylase superfamily)